MFHVDIGREFDMAIEEGKRMDLEGKRKKEKECLKTVQPRSESETRRYYAERFLRLLFGKNRK